LKDNFESGQYSVVGMTNFYVLKKGGVDCSNLDSEIEELLDDLEEFQKIK